MEPLEKISFEFQDRPQLPDRVAIVLTAASGVETKVDLSDTQYEPLFWWLLRVMEKRGRVSGGPLFKVKPTK